MQGSVHSSVVRQRVAANTFKVSNFSDWQSVHSLLVTPTKPDTMRCLQHNTAGCARAPRLTSRAPLQVAASAAGGKQGGGFGKTNKKNIESNEQTGSYTMRTNKKRVNVEDIGKEDQTSKPSTSGAPQVDLGKGNW